MNFVSRLMKRKSSGKYSSLKKSNSETELNMKIENSTENKTFYIYTTGILNWLNLEEEQKIYLKWKIYFKNIINDIPIKYKVKVIHYDPNMLRDDNDINYDLNNNIYDEITHYLKDHGKNIPDKIDPERISIEFIKESMNENVISEIKNPHIIYDFAGIFIQSREKTYLNLYAYGSNKDEKVLYENINVIYPEFWLLNNYNIDIDYVKLFNLDDKGNVETYNSKLNKLLYIDNQNCETTIDFVLNKFKEIWIEHRNNYWEVNKHRLQLHNFGCVGEIKWQKITLELLFNFIWIEEYQWYQIKEFLASQYDDMLHEVL
jgi:hypothetical protein